MALETMALISLLLLPEPSVVPQNTLIMSELDYEVASLSQRVKMGKYVSCIQELPIREPRGQWTGRAEISWPTPPTSHAPPPRRFFFQCQPGSSESGWRVLFVCFYFGCAFQRCHHSLTEPPLTYNKTPGCPNPKVCLNLIRICHMLRNLCLGCQSCHQRPALYPSPFQ